MLKGKKAVVTGSSGGIGFGIAKALAAAGCDVTMNGFGDRDAIEAARAELARTYGVDVRYSPADMSRPDEVVAMVEEATRAFGQVDILCNNAGVLNTPPAPVEEVAPERWDMHIAVNVSAAFHAIRAVLPQMKARDWGRIVNTASTAGLVGMTNSAPYIASKHAIVGLTKVVALETAATGITCNAICPGLVGTPFVKDRIEAGARKRGVSFQEVAEIALRGRQPSKKLVEVEHIAGTVLHLCEDMAATITGAAIPVDQAWTAM